MTFDLFCTSCRRRYLLGARGLRSLRNLLPGVILLELVCPRGHSVLLMTGSALQAHR